MHVVVSVLPVPSHEVSVVCVAALQLVQFEHSGLPETAYWPAMHAAHEPGAVELWLKPALHWHTVSSATPEHLVNSSICIEASHGVQGRHSAEPTVSE